MKARIVDVAEIRKTPEEREAEELLNQLGPGKAIEIALGNGDTPKRIGRLYRCTAKNMGKMVRIETMDKGKKLLVCLKYDADDDD